MRKTILFLICLFAASVEAVAQLKTATTPDEIFYNGKILTVDGSFSIAQAIAVRREEILAVGSSAEVRKLAGPNTRLTDLKGHTVIPGLMDNHNHQYNAAWIAYRGVDTAGVKSKQELLNRILQGMANAKPGEPVITNIGWADSPGIAAPTRAELDEISPTRILVVMRARGTAYLNSAALKAAGITRNTIMVGGNVIPKDSTGEPTGQIGPPNTVNNVVPAIVPWPPVNQQIEMIEKMQEAQLALGLTSIREVELKTEGMRAYQEMRRQGRLKMRISMGIDVQATDWDKLDEILSPMGAGPGFGDHWLRLDSVSEFAIDSNANVALFREPKLNPAGELGTMRITPEQIKQAMITINKYGWRPAIHITGDGTLDKVLDAYEAANAISPIAGKRWIVEHIPYVHPDQMERMATVNNAYIKLEEDAKGSLEPGKLADFLILSEDFMAVPEDKIEEIKPLATYVGGKKMYSAPAGGF